MGKKKKTHEEFVAQVYAKYGDEYSVLSLYISYHEPVDIRHNPCGRVKPKTPARFFSQINNCKSCNSQKKTQEQFEQEVYEAVGDRVTVLGKYINYNTSVLFKDHDCGHEFKTKPDTFFRSKKCTQCSTNFKKTHEQFVQEVYDLVGTEYTVLSLYENARSIIDFRHNVCGNTLPKEAQSFLSGIRCRECSKEAGPKKHRHTHEQFVREVEEMYGTEYTVLGTYFNNTTPVLIRHNICGHEWEPIPRNFKKERKCPKCRRGLQRTTQQYKEEVFALVDDEYTVLGDFESISKGILTRHNKCGCEWKPTPRNFLHHGRRCPDCKESKGEKAIAKWLKKQGVLFERQYKIDDCRNIKPLPFDFAVFLRDGSFLLIEYQGLQHFKATDHYGGMEGFIYRQKNDGIKREYCRTNGIYLLEIPHWDFKKIDQILANDLLPLHLSPSNQPFEQLAFVLR